MVANGRRAMRLDDMFRLQTIVDVAMSPDGARVAFVVHACDAAADREFASLWLHDVASGKTVRLTHGAHRDVFPRWSPDGAALAFMSDRPTAEGSGGPGATNVFVLRPDQPGEPVQLTDSPDPVSDFRWSPDGRRLCLVITTTDASASNMLQYDSMRFSDPPASPWIEGGYAHLWIREADGTLRQLTDGAASDSAPTWSADASRIAFVTNRRDDAEFIEAADIWLVPADGSTQPAPLYQAVNPSEWDGSPAFSPVRDEVAVVGVAPASAGRPHPHPHLLVIDATGGDVRDTVAGWDRPVGNHLLSETRRHAGAPAASWSADGESLFFIATDRGAAHLYRATRGGMTPQCLDPGDHEIVAYSFDQATTTFAAVISTASRPTELYLGTVGGELRRVTSLNDDLLAELDLTELEPFSFTSSDGYEIEGWVLRPPGADAGPRSTILRIAGGPGLAYGHSFVEDSHLMVASGHAVCFINPRGTQSYGERFAAELDGGWLGGDYDDQMAAVDHLVASGVADPQRLGVTGASYGGLMVNWIVTQTDRFAAAVSQRSIANLISIMGVGPLITNLIPPDFGRVNPALDPGPYVAKSPLTHVKNVTTPLLLIQAGQDCMTPVGQALEFFVALRSLGKRARLVVFKDGEHYLRRYGRPSDRLNYAKAMLAWMDEHLASARP